MSGRLVVTSSGGTLPAISCHRAYCDCQGLSPRMAGTLEAVISVLCCAVHGLGASSMTTLGIVYPDSEVLLKGGGDYSAGASDLEALDGELDSINEVAVGVFAYAV